MKPTPGSAMERHNELKAKVKGNLTNLKKKKKAPPKKGEEAKEPPAETTSEALDPNAEKAEAELIAASKK